MFALTNRSIEGAEFVWVSECQKGGCEIINQFVCEVSSNSVSSVITTGIFNWL
jgi:hypothetical protein